MRGKIRGRFIKIIRRFGSFIKADLPRLIIYSLLLVVAVAAFVATTNINLKIEKIAAKQEQSEKSVVAWKILEKKKNDYQALGLDVTAIEAKFSQIYQALYTTNDFVLADSLIKETDSQLDSLYVAYQTKQKSEELLRGDLSGQISCSGGVCPLAVKIILTSGSSDVATIEADTNGKYSFHITAGSYNLSVSASGYKSAVKTNVSIIGQQLTSVDINLTKIVATAPASNTGSGSTATTGSATGASSDSTATPGASQEVTRLFELINSYRQGNGLSALILDPLISNAAAGHSAWMQSTGSFSHTGSGGSLPWDRCASAGTSCSGEIIFKGGTGSDGAFEGWKNSPPHNTLMLKASFSAIGIGIAGKYYTADFR